MGEVLRTTCSRDCPDSCGIVVRVEDGRVVEHRGDPLHGVTRGFLCARGKEYLERQYHPDRLLHPLKRTGSGWQRVSWDTALDLTAEHLSRAKASFGPLSVLGVSYSGIRTWVARVLWRRFWAHFGGATLVRGGLSVEAAVAAQVTDFGGDATHDPEDLVNARAIVIWGKNPAVTRPHWLPFLKEARRRGAALAVVDPVRTATAHLADAWYQIRPGTDGVLALGVARRLIERDAIDHPFVASHTAGFEAFRRLTFARSLDEVAQVTDLQTGDIEAIADLYATRKPLATAAGLGPAYYANGAAQVRCVDALAAITGNLGVAGGGVHTDILGDPGFDLSALAGLQAEARRSVLLPRLGEEVLAAQDPPIRVAYVAGANPAATAPDTGRVLEALRTLDFVVVVDQFMTATASAAHLVLPCTTYLEMDDLVTAYGHNWMGVTRQVVPPLGECRSDGEILQGLAERLGFGPALAGSAEAWVERLLAPLAGAGVTLAALRERPCRRPNAVAVPFADRRFGTPSGRVELIGELPQATLGGSAPGRLRLLATKSRHMVNSQIQPSHLAPEPVARLHPETLRGLGLTDGDHGLLASAAGRVRVRLVADPVARRDVVQLNPARWQGDLEGVNQLREAYLTDAGEGAAMHETFVTVSAV